MVDSWHLMLDLRAVALRSLKLQADKPQASRLHPALVDVPFFQSKVEKPCENHLSNLLKNVLWSSTGPWARTCKRARLI